MATGRNVSIPSFRERGYITNLEVPYQSVTLDFMLEQTDELGSLRKSQRHNHYAFPAPHVSCLVPRTWWVGKGQGFSQGMSIAAVPFLHPI